MSVPTTGPTPSRQAAKLGIKAGCRLRLDHPPSGWSLESPPPLQLVADGEAADVTISFYSQASELSPRLESLAEAIFPDGSLWLAWPRRAGGHSSDLTDNVVRNAALPLGLVDTKVAALDQDWSALRFVWRVERRRR
jgi:hypothetical protein